MTADADLIAALRKCEHCRDGNIDTGRSTTSWPCPHCRLARMAAARIEHYRSAAETNNEASKMLKQLVAEIVRERCAKECEHPLVTGWQCARVIRALTVDELLKEPSK